eukprot:scaffold3540_cov379-Prasinococcus_capsulatus_cf.AAC.4
MCIWGPAGIPRASVKDWGKLEVSKEETAEYSSVEHARLSKVHRTKCTMRPWTRTLRFLGAPTWAL